MQHHRYHMTIAIQPDNDMIKPPAAWKFALASSGGTAAAVFAAAMRALEGTQPVFRQSPPM